MVFIFNGIKGGEAALPLLVKCNIVDVGRGNAAGPIYPIYLPPQPQLATIEPVRRCGLSPPTTIIVPRLKHLSAYPLGQLPAR